MKARAGKTPTVRPRWGRRDEQRVIELCARGDYRLSRWLRAGDPHTLAGVAAMLASQPGFDRTRMLALAERLHPGISAPEGFGRWLARTPVQAARFLPMLEARMRDRKLPAAVPLRRRAEAALSDYVGNLGRIRTSIDAACRLVAAADKKRQPDKSK